MRYTHAPTPAEIDAHEARELEALALRSLPALAETLAAILAKNPGVKAPAAFEELQAQIAAVRAKAAANRKG